MTVYRAVGASYAAAFDQLAQILYVTDARKISHYEVERNKQQITLTVHIGAIYGR